MSLLDEDTDEPWGIWDGKCQACDCYGPVNDLSLCEDCAGKLERDLIRQRDWDYSVSAFGLPPEAPRTGPFRRLLTPIWRVLEQRTAEWEYRCERSKSLSNMDTCDEFIVRRTTVWV